MTGQFQRQVGAAKPALARYTTKERAKRNVK